MEESFLTDNATADTLCHLFDDLPPLPHIENFTLYSLCVSVAGSSDSACDAVSIPVELPPLAGIWDNMGNNTQAKTAEVHAVCTVQTFQNPLSGPMLYMFTRFYLELGWVVIVYDRFGAHRDFLSSLLDSQTDQRLKYYPYTLFQLLFPNTYNTDVMASQVSTALLTACVCLCITSPGAVQTTSVSHYEHLAEV